MELLSLGAMVGWGIFCAAEYWELRESVYTESIDYLINGFAASFGFLAISVVGSIVSVCSLQLNRAVLRRRISCAAIGIYIIALLSLVIGWMLFV